MGSYFWHFNGAMTNFGDLKSNSGVKALNDYLADRSYIDGYVPTQGDVTVFNGLGKAPADSFAHALRWYKQISSYGSEKSKFPAGSGKVGAGSPAKMEVDDDDEDAEAARVREERLKAYAEKKSAKPGPIAKSQIMLDVKPWDDETDMKAMEDAVRTISMDGLVWG